MTKTKKIKLVERFLCPGCVAGSNVKCGSFDPGQPRGAPWGQCLGHVLGTVILPAPGNIALGMPKGFNRPGWCPHDKRTHARMKIRVWPRGVKPDWDWLNVPVWALEQNGFLFVRTAMPRVGEWFVDVIEGGTAALCPQAINVTDKYEEYD